MPLWNLFSLLSTLVLPQLLGVLLYFRLGRFPRWLAFIIGVLAPPVIFFFIGQIFFFADVREAAATGERNCGLIGMAATMALVFVTGVQTVIALIVQFVLFAKRVR